MNTSKNNQRFNEILEILDQLRIQMNRDGLTEGHFESAKKEVELIFTK